MPKGDKIEFDGVVKEVLPNATFIIKIALPNSNQEYLVRGYISGKMRMNYIRIVAGDKVKIEVDPNDLTQGRITFRYNTRDDRPLPPRKS